MEAEHSKVENEYEEDAQKPRGKGLGLVAVESGRDEKHEKEKPGLIDKTKEHIGHVLVTSAETNTEKYKDIAIDTLSRAELLNLSEQIVIDGSSLRQIYETHLIGERGLRRLVEAHLQGDDLKKALRLEIIEREIDFERDPHLRDMNPAHYVSELKKADKTFSNKDFESMLKKAVKDLPAGNEEVAFLKARANYEATQLAQHKQQRRSVDVAMIVIIAILVILVLILIGRS